MESLGFEKIVSGKVRWQSYRQIRGRDNLVKISEAVYDRFRREGHHRRSSLVPVTLAGRRRGRIDIAANNLKGFLIAARATVWSPRTRYAASRGKDGLFIIILFYGGSHRPAKNKATLIGDMNAQTTEFLVEILDYKMKG